MFKRMAQYQCNIQWMMCRYSKLNEIHKSMEFMSTQYDDLLKEHKRCLQENISMKKEINELREIHTKTSNELVIIQQDLNTIHQKEINNNIVVFGLPSFKTKEEIKNTFDNILGKFQIDIQDVKEYQIYQGKGNEMRPGPPLVKFQNNNIKTLVLQASKGKELFANEVGLNARSKLRFKEQLTLLDIDC